MAARPKDQLDITELDPAVQHFCEQGVAMSTHKTYQSALHKFAQFCALYDIVTPFPVSEALLCYFASYLGCAQLSPQTIKVYLAAIRHMQVTMGLPEPREYSSMPRLRLMQSGIQRCYSQKGAPKIRMPITPVILQRMKEYWNAQRMTY